MNVHDVLAVAPTIRASLQPPESTPYGLFVAAYHEIATVCRQIARPGLAVFAIADSGAVLGTRVVIDNKCVVPILIGRHDFCDIVIEHPAVPLRQLAIAVEPCNGEAVAYRVVHLHPDGDLTDETGRGVRSLRADGVAILRCAAYTLFVLPIGEPLHWTPRADLTWTMLPQRIYIDDRNTTPPPHHLSTSVAFRMSGPRFSLEDLVDDDRVGTLELMQPHGSTALAVGMRALADGILIGRSASRERLHVSDPTLSRAHALLTRVGAQVVAIDLASTFGTGHPEAIASRVCVLGADTELWLGHSTRLRWRTAVVPYWGG